MWSKFRMEKAARSLVRLGLLLILLASVPVQAEPKGEPDWDDPEYAMMMKKASMTEEELKQMYDYVPEAEPGEDELPANLLSLADSYTGKVYDHGDLLDGATLRYGVDVSKWQERVDWPRVKASGINFAFVRIAYTKRLQEEFEQATDEWAETNLAGASAAGLDVGVYYFSQAVTTAEAVKEAEYVLDFLDGRALDLPVVFDYEADEGYRNYDLSRRQGTDICLAFCRRIREGGYRSCVYCNTYFMREKVYADELDTDNLIWVARYNNYVFPKDYTGYIPNYTFWQYAASDVNGFTVPGIGESDLDFWYYTEDLSSHKKPAASDPASPSLEAPELGTPSCVSNGVKLEWSPVSGCSRYRVLRRENGGSWESLGMTADSRWTDKEAVSGVDYYYTVCCVSDDGKKVLSPVEEEGIPFRYLSGIPEEDITLTNGLGYVMVNWEPVMGAKGYYVYRKVPGGSYTRIRTVTGLDNTSWKDTGVTGGKYVYAIRAYAGSVKSAYVGIEHLYLTPICAEDLTLTARTDGVKISWPAVTGAESYVVYRKEKGGSWVRLATVSSGTKSWLDSKALFGKEVYYAVRALAGSTRSDYEAKSYLWLAPVTAADLTLKNVSGGVQITWKKVTGAEGYRVYRKVDGGSYKRITTLTGADKVTFTDTGAVSGTSYIYAVRALRGDILGAYEGKKIVYLTAIPSSKLTLTNTSSGVKLSWSSVTGAQGYRIYRKTTGNSYSLLTAVSGRTTVTWTDTSAANGTAYTYAVRAYNGSSYGYFGGVTTVRLKGVSLKTVAAYGTGGLKVTLAGRNTGAAGYQIQYSTSSSFASGNRQVSITDPDSLTKTITGLTSGKRYYVRVRCYRKTGSTTCYSAWSDKLYASAR